MKTFKEELQAYAAGRQSGISQLLTYISVPAVVLGALILLSWVSLSIMGKWNITFAWAAIALLFAYYFRLHVKLAVLALAVLIVATLFCTWIAYPAPNLFNGFLLALLFVGGLILHFSGQPVSRDKRFVSHALKQLRIAPLYWLVEMIRLLKLERYFDLDVFDPDPKQSEQQR